MGLNLTAEFLGDPADWPAAQLCLDDVHGLWGGRRLFLSGVGALVVQPVSPAQQEERYALEVAPDEAHAVFALCVEHDLLSLSWPPRPVIPDEVTLRLTLVNAAGEARSVSKLGGDAHAGFDQVGRALLGLEQRARATRPIYTGAFQASYRPEWS